MTFNQQKNPFSDDRAELLLELTKGKKRFWELKKIFKSPATLTARLRQLESLQLIDRELVKGSRSKVYYYITPKGQKAAEAYKGYIEQLKNLF
jgi:DNA-binding HxlR family transcriptional regulator